MSYSEPPQRLFPIMATALDNEWPEIIMLSVFPVCVPVGKNKALQKMNFGLCELMGLTSHVIRH